MARGSSTSNPRASGKEAGSDSIALRVFAERPPAELRAAQLVVADHVNNDDRLNDGWEREADLMELLDMLGLYRRV